MEHILPPVELQHLNVVEDFGELLSLLFVKLILFLPEWREFSSCFCEDKKNYHHGAAGEHKDPSKKIEQINAPPEECCCAEH